MSDWGVGTVRDFERWAREALPVSVEHCTVLARHPEVGHVTLLIRWKHGRQPGNEVREEIVRSYVQRQAPINHVVHVESVESVA